MSGLSAVLSGELLVAPPASLTIEDRRSSGNSFPLGLHTLNRAPDTEASRLCVQLAAGAFRDIGYPSADLRASGVYIRQRDSGNAVYSVRLTLATTGNVDVPSVRGTFFAEFGDADLVTDLLVDGDVTIEWAAWGQRV